MHIADSYWNYGSGLPAAFDEDCFTFPAQHNLKSLRIHHVLTEFLCFLAADFFYCRRVTADDSLLTVP